MQLILWRQILLRGGSRAERSHDFRVGPDGIYGGLPGSSIIKYHWNSFQGYDDAFLPKAYRALNLASQSSEWN